MNPNEVQALQQPAMRGSCCGKLEMHQTARRGTRRMLATGAYGANDRRRPGLLASLMERMEGFYDSN